MKNQNAKQEKERTKLETLLDFVLFKPCEARYTFFRKSPFSLVEQARSCEEAKKHLSRMTNKNREVYLSLYYPSRFNSGLIKKDAEYHAKELTAEEAKNKIEEFQSRFGR